MRETVVNTAANHPLNAVAWYAIVTKYRHEKSVARFLKRIDIDSFIPLKKVIRRYASGKKIFEIPLISCYVFANMNLREHVRVLEIPGVLGFIKFCNEIVEIPEEDMNLLKRINGGEYPIEVMDHSIRAGDEVEVIAGNLTGIKGRLIKISNKKRFVVSIDNIGRSFTLEIDSRILKPLKTH